MKENEKVVVFLRNGIIHMTTYNNYKAVIQDANLIIRFDGFDTYEQVEEYLINYCGAKKENITNMIERSNW